MVGQDIFLGPVTVSPVLCSGEGGPYILVPLIFLKETVSSFLRRREALGRQPLSDPRGPLTQT